MKRALLVLAILGLGVSGFSQELTLSFEEAVKIGLSQNVELAKASNNLSASMAWKQSAIASLLPRLSASANAYTNIGKTFSTDVGALVDTTSHGARANFDANIDLFTGLSRFHSFKQANHTFSAQQSTLKRTQQTVLFLVASQYLAVLQDQELLEIASKNLDAQKQLNLQISEFVNAGSRARLDLLNQEAILRGSELDVLRAQLGLRNNKATLANTLRLDPGTDFAVADPSWNIESLSMGEYPTLSVMYDIALANRADLQSSKEREQASERAVAASKGNFMPRLSGFYNYSTRYTSLDSDEFDKQFFTVYPNQVYGVTLNIPIFNGLGNRAQFVQSKVESENSKLDREYLELSVRSDVLREYQNYVDLKEAYETSKSAFEAAELAHTSQQESYRLGLGTQIDVSTAYANLVRAQTDMANLEYALLFQKIMLDYALGTLTTDDF